jgi:amino acid permease
LVAIAEIPFVLVSKIQKLKFLALGGAVCIIIFMTVFVLLVVVAAADSNPDNNPAGNMRILPDNWLLAAATVPNVLLALSYQMNFFPIYKGMKDVSDRKMSRAVTLGLLFCLFSYLLVGILGYYYAGNKV